MNCLEMTGNQILRQYGAEQDTYFPQWQLEVWIKDPHETEIYIYNIHRSEGMFMNIVNKTGGTNKIIQNLKKQR